MIDANIQTDGKQLNNNEEESIHVGKNLRHFRKRKGWAQNRMAAELNTVFTENKETLFPEVECKSIVQQYVHNWEKALSVPEYVSKLYALTLKLDEEWLLKHNFYKGQNDTFYQEGENNNNFQTIEQVHFTIQNPVEPLEKAHKETITTLTSVYNDAQTRADQQFKQAVEIYDKALSRMERINDAILEKLSKM